MRLMDEEIYLLPYERSPDKKIVYSPVKGYVTLIDQQDADAIEKGITYSLEDCKENNAITQVLKSLKELPVKDLDLMQKGFPALNIDFSSGCNMRCLYCYAGRGEGNVKYQKKENIEQIITVYFDYLKQLSDFKEQSVCSIIFSNDAEPTFVPDLLIHTVNLIKETARRYDIEPNFSMPTNGAFCHDLCEFIIENFKSISLSFDALEFIQNKHRPLADGSSSYIRVYQNAKSLYNSGIKMGFNIVVTTYNLSYLKETIDYFHQHFPGAAISFSPVSLSGRALKEQAQLRVDKAEFQIRLIEALEYAKTTSIKIHDKNTQDYHKPRRHYCASTAKPNWNVNLQGEIYACMESKAEIMRIGAVNFETGELKLEDKHIRSLKAYTVDQRSECIDCFAKYLCVGGCKVRYKLETMACHEIRLKCLSLINQTYEQEQLFKKGQALFRINKKK